MVMKKIKAIKVQGWVKVLPVYPFTLRGTNPVEPERLLRTCRCQQYHREAEG